KIVRGSPLSYIETISDAIRQFTQWKDLCLRCVADLFSTSRAVPELWLVRTGLSIFYAWKRTPPTSI
ncbi:hypothetical protein J6590_089528, partial [Homalodisca vitripennis]